MSDEKYGDEETAPDSLHQLAIDLLAKKKGEYAFLLVVTQTIMQDISVPALLILMQLGVARLRQENVRLTAFDRDSGKLYFEQFPPEVEIEDEPPE